MPGRMEPCEHGRYNGAVDLEHHVHTAALFHIFPLDAVKPQNLRIAFFGGFIRGAVGSGVVPAAFCLTGAAADGADVFGSTTTGMGFGPTSEQLPEGERMTANVAE